MHILIATYGFFRGPKRPRGGRVVHPEEKRQAADSTELRVAFFCMDCGWRAALPLRPLPKLGRIDGFFFS